MRRYSSAPAKLLAPLKFGDQKISPVVLGLSSEYCGDDEPVNDGLDDYNDVSR